MVDLSIARLLWYGRMPRPRRGLMFALCVGSLALAGCGGKAPVRAAAPQPAPQPSYARGFRAVVAACHGKPQRLAALRRARDLADTGPNVP